MRKQVYKISLYIVNVKLLHYKGKFKLMLAYTLNAYELAWLIVFQNVICPVTRDS